MMLFSSAFSESNLFSITVYSTYYLFLYLSNYFFFTNYQSVFFVLIGRLPRSTLFPTRRSSDLMGFGKRSAFQGGGHGQAPVRRQDRKSTRLNSSHVKISYAVFCLKKKKERNEKKENLEH